MIAKAKSIAHGVNAIVYMSGESNTKKHPELIDHVCNQHMPPHLDGLGMWNMMQLQASMRPNVRNNVIRIELSPLAEHTRGFTLDDWQKLWHEFVEEFDRQSLTDKRGKQVSRPTNLAGSMATVWLHRESKSGTPHLHAAVCRVDMDGRINDDHNIHLRAQRAAERVALRRGWTTAASRHEENVERVSRDCMACLKAMPRWNVDDYFVRLRGMGYDVRQRRDAQGQLRGYVLSRPPLRSTYKASSLGKGRALTVSRLEATWQKIHGQAARRQSKTAMAMRHRVTDYTKPMADTTRVEIDHGGERHVRFIPNAVMDRFDNEFDWRSTANAGELINLAAYYFAVARSFAAKLDSGPSSGGANREYEVKSDNSEIKNEIERALRCAEAARAKLGVTLKSLSL